MSRSPARSMRLRVTHPLLRAALLGAALCCGLTAVALAEPTVGFDPAQITVLHRECSQDTFTVAVVVDATPTPVQGFEIIFRFDPAVIMPVEVIEGQLLQQSGFPTFFTWTNQAAVGDSVHIDAAVLGGTFQGPGELAQLRFEKLMPGFSDLTWWSLTFRDASNLPIPVLSTDGLVTIEACPVPRAPATWGEVKRQGVRPPTP